MKYKDHAMIRVHKKFKEKWFNKRKFEGESDAECLYRLLKIKRDWVYRFDE